jgi:shikimate 5-dehydrogenase
VSVTWGPGDELVPAQTPTMYFIGVTTGSSSIRKVFDLWAKILNRPDVILVGIDLPLHAEPEEYRRVAGFLKNDPLSLGALVTTHKVDLLRSCRDMFDVLDEGAISLHEVSCLSKSGGKFQGSAKDPLTSALALDAFMPDTHWQREGAEVVCLGAGGSALALASSFTKTLPGVSGPNRVVVTNRSAKRLEEFAEDYEALGGGPAIELVHAPEPEINDFWVSQAAPGSLIVNATGLGKDSPGSPLSWNAEFPENGFAWDFNYRGDLVFLDQAKAQQVEKNLRIEDGWIYFLHGWTQVIAEVLDIPIEPNSDLFAELAEAAESVRSGS